MNQVISRVRPVRTYLLMAYDFAAWVASFVAMATLQYLVGYSPQHDIIPAARVSKYEVASDLPVVGPATLFGRQAIGAAR